MRSPRGRGSLSECRDRKWESTHVDGCRDPSAVRHAGAESLGYYTFQLLYKCMCDLIKGCYSELGVLKLLLL